MRGFLARRRVRTLRQLQARPGLPSPGGTCLPLAEVRRSEGHAWHAGGRSQLEVLPLLDASRTQRRLALRSPGRCTSPVDIEGASDASPVGPCDGWKPSVSSESSLVGLRAHPVSQLQAAAALKTVSAVDTGCQSTLRYP